MRGPLSRFTVARHLAGLAARRPRPDDQYGFTGWGLTPRPAAAALIAAAHHEIVPLPLAGPEVVESPPILDLYVFVPPRRAAPAGR